MSTMSIDSISIVLKGSLFNHQVWGNYGENIFATSESSHDAQMILLPLVNWGQILLTKLPSWWCIVYSDTHDHDGAWKFDSI